MSLTGKWFGFGTDADYDEGARAFEDGRYADAAGSFAKVADRNRDPAMRQISRLHLGDCYGRLLRESLATRDGRRAIEWGRKAVELNPNFPDLRLQLGRAFLLIDDFESAECSILKAIEINERYAEAMVLRAGLAARLGEPWHDIAEGAFAINASLRETAESLIVRTEAGDAYAWKTLQALTSAHSRDANIIAGEADDLARQKLFPAAALRYQKALEMAPRYADIRCRYGQTLLELDRLEAAEEQFRIALDINPRYAEAWAQLGVTLKRQRRDDEARVAFEKACAVDPNHIIASQEIRRHSWR